MMDCYCPITWVVGCFGLNDPLRQYFSLYRVVITWEKLKLLEANIKGVHDFNDFVFNLFIEIDTQFLCLNYKCV